MNQLDGAADAAINEGDARQLQLVRASDAGVAAQQWTAILLDERVEDDLVAGLFASKLGGQLARAPRPSRSRLKRGRAEVMGRRRA